MSPADHITNEEALRALWKKYQSPASLTEAELDTLVRHGFLNRRNGSYWAGPRAATLRQKG